MRWSISFVLGGALLCSGAAGPVEFGLAEFNAALDASNLKTRIKYDVSLEPAESFRIEPYAAGGAHISGGDLRGLMYALLEAADQVRATGRMKQTHETASIAIRGIRRFAQDDLADWQPYFEMLARDRFNRLTLIYSEPPADLEKLRTISQLASDYAVDFTLALWYEPDDSVARIIAACPQIRTMQIRAPSKSLDGYRVHVFDVVKNVGRRIALDPDPEIAEAARAESVALRSDPQGWPPNFEIEAPADFESHGEFYWLWGRVGYDPKSKPAHPESLEEIHAAAQIVSLLAMSKTAASEWIAVTPDAVANRALALAAAASDLTDSTMPDLQLLAQRARDESTRLHNTLPADFIPDSPPPRPTFTHTVIHTATPDHAIDLLLQIAPVKDVAMVRLHYRALDAAATQILEKPAAASVAFTIPPQPADILYYFEIAGHGSGGWFEPDPMQATPYHIIRIQPAQPAQ